MTTDILNLPKWDVLELEEGHAEYIIKARYTVQPSACPSCGVMFPRLHRYGTKQQPYRDLPIHGKRVKLIVIKKRWKCLECNHIFLERLDDLDDHHRATKRLVQWVQEKALERPFTHLAVEIGVDEGTIRNVFNRHIAELDEKITFETPRWLGIDELHLLHSARCIIVNVEARTIIDVLESRKRPVVVNRLMRMPNRERVTLVAMDMWTPYRDAVQGVFPNAVIVIDKFHVLKMATKAVDLVRKRIREGLTDRKRRLLMHERFLLLRRAKDLKPEKAMILQTWLDQFSDLKAAYELKEELFDLWDGVYTSTTARNQYKVWLEKATASGVLWAFEELTTAVGNWDAEVFAYFDHPVTNAVTEALNGLAKITNRMGRGYSFKAIRAKMLYASRNRKPKQPVVTERPMTYSQVTTVREYGIDIDDLYIWFLDDDQPEYVDGKRVDKVKLSTFVQRAGRAARRSDSTHESE